MMQRRCATAAALLLAIFPVGGCRNQSSTIAVIPRTTATLLWEPMHFGAAEEAHKNGMHVYWNAPADESDVEKQLPYETGIARQDTNSIALRWSQWAIYGRDQWQVTPKLSLDYGIRWEYYPMAYSDHGKGARVLDPTTMQVLIGGYGSVSKNDGVQVGPGEFLPRVGIDYRVDSKTVVRAGFGISADSNNWRYLRNDYPADTVTQYSGTNTGGTTNYTPFAPAASLERMRLDRTQPCRSALYRLLCRALQRAPFRCPRT